MLASSKTRACATRFLRELFLAQSVSCANRFLRELFLAQAGKIDYSFASIFT